MAFLLVVCLGMLTLTPLSTLLVRKVDKADFLFEAGRLRRIWPLSGTNHADASEQKNIAEKGSPSISSKTIPPIFLFGVDPCYVFYGVVLVFALVWGTLKRGLLLWTIGRRLCYFIGGYEILCERCFLTL